MEKLKVGDTVRIKNERGFAWHEDMLKFKGKKVVIYNFGADLRFKGGGFNFRIQDGDRLWTFDDDDIQEEIAYSTESRSKQISQSLKQICTKGLVIKSEDIIAKVKESIGTEYVFGDTILRSLRHLRQDGILDYTADKHTREYTFK